MEYLPLILSATLINIFGAISPGPDFVMCVRNSVSYSRKTGIYTGLGIALGLTVHMFYCSVGIGLLIYNSPFIFNILKYLGAGYLAYIGVMSLISKSEKVEIESANGVSLSNFQAFRTGLLTNILNPKATLFFLAFFTMVVKPETPIWVVVVVFVIVVLTAVIWFSIVAILFSHTVIRNRYIRYQRAINTIFGILLIGIGLKIALMK